MNYDYVIATWKKRKKKNKYKHLHKSWAWSAVALASFSSQPGLGQLLALSRSAEGLASDWC